jgi:NTP pyrophosphatase (non-canonical NTP hydrolase)
MTEQEHLLSCLAEECAEVAQEVSKALRFGLDNVYPQVPGERTVRAKIKAESVDLIAVLQLLVEKKILEDGWDERLCQEKKDKIARFMEYARQQGALQ